MRKWILKLSIIVVPIVLCLSMVLVVGGTGDTEYAQNLFDTENDYRLKFVDSTDIELNLGATDKVILPFDIESVSDEGGDIVVKTKENTVVLSPVECVVNSASSLTSEVELKSGNITVVIIGIISGVKTGNCLRCGDVIGTIKGTQCIVKVFWGTRKLSLDEIRMLI